MALRKVHVFTTHFQANYIYLSPEEVEGCFFLQFENALTSKRFIEQIVEANQPKKDTKIMMGSHNEESTRIINSSTETNTQPDDIYLFMGDLNIDAIPNFQKASLHIKYENEFDVMKHMNFYSSNKQLDEDKPIVSRYLKKGGRYGLLMALLNSGNLRFDDIAYAYNKNQHLPTYGLSYKDDKINEVMPLETAFTHPEDQMSDLCLDYVMVISPESSASRSSQSLIDSIRMQNSKKIKIRACNIKNFEASNQMFSHLSDHAGIETILKLY
jgi:hypothetical protein